MTGVAMPQKIVMNHDEKLMAKTKGKRALSRIEAVNRRMLMETLMYNKEESIKILFHPTTDLIIKEYRRLMLEILDAQTSLHDEYYPLPLDKKEVQKEHLLDFMQHTPDKVIELLQNPQLDQYDRIQMESILKSPQNNRQVNIAIEVKKSELQALDITKLKTIYEALNTDMITKRAIFQLYPENENIKKMATKELIQWITHASLADIDNKIEPLEDVDYNEQELMDSLIKDNNIVIKYIVSKQLETENERKFIKEKQFEPLEYVQENPEEHTQRPVITHHFDQKRKLKDTETKSEHPNRSEDNSKKPKH